MQIHGFNKTTLLDYPKHLAATIFIGSCNYRCPFCHNSSLVLSPHTQPVIPMVEVLSVLKKRKNILEGVCITGGEPTLQKDLPELITSIKELGLKVKLDTNGTNYPMLEYLYTNNMLDYVAMDIKSSKENYGIASGTQSPFLSMVCSSVELLLNSGINYEFRTTVVRELVREEDVLAIGQWLKGANAYFLQAFKDSNTIGSNLNGYTLEEMNHFKELLIPYINNVSLRGIEEL